MKNIFKTIVSAALVAGISACSSFIEEDPVGNQGLDNYFTNEEECQASINGCYQGILWDDWWQTDLMNLLSDMASDDLWMGNTTQSASEYEMVAHYNNPKAAGPLSNYWQYRYKGILRCNIAIERIANATIADTELRDRLVAEAKFIRGLQYFELVKNFGGVPYVDGMYMPSEIKGIQRSSAEDIYSYIEQDWKDAIAVLPLKSEYSSADLGRATKGAAMGYLAKAYLYQEKYDLAEKYLDSVIMSGEYQLQPEFSDVWTIETNNGVESVFDVQYIGTLSYSLGGRLSVVTGSRNDSGWSWGLPTSDLENAFLSIGDTERLKWTIVTHGDDVPGDADATNYVIKPSEHKSARINRKFYIPKAQRPEKYDDPHIPLNWRLLRYADILLMYAEASYEIGNTGNALDALNLVHTRANLTAYTSLSGTALRDAIRLERRLELACEHNRLYDLRRWNDDNGKKALCNVMGPNGTFVRYNTVTSTDPYETTNTGELQNKGYYFQEARDLLFPIPNTEVVQSGGSIVQNPNF